MRWIRERSDFKLCIFLTFILLGNICQRVECENPDNPKDASKDTILKASEEPQEKDKMSDFDHLSHPTEQVVNTDKQVDFGFIHAFAASISVIIVSELGDKTFFIAAIMAMRHSRLTVYIGAMLALGLMTVLSCFLGYATTIIPRTYTYYISTGLFALFGLRMLKEGYDMDPNEGQEELEEVQAELKKGRRARKREKVYNTARSRIWRTIRGGVKRYCLGLLSAIFLQAFTLTFLAEWGDRSQLTTIILAARENVFGVAIGGTIGHGLCTALAVLGGRLIAQKYQLEQLQSLVE